MLLTTNHAEIAISIVCDRSSRSIPAEELVVRRELVPRPPVAPLAVCVLGHSRVLQKGNVAATLHQALERPCNATTVRKGKVYVG